MSTLPTPRTDAAAKQIGSIAARWKNRDIGAQLFSDLCEQQFYNLRSQERELTEAKAERDAARAALADSDSIRHGEKRILLDEIAQHTAARADLSRWRALAEELAGALEVFANLDVEHMVNQRKPHAHPVFGLNSTLFVLGDVLNARQLLAHFRDAANPASGAAITPVIHRSE